MRFQLAALCALACVPGPLAAQSASSGNAGDDSGNEDRSRSFELGEIIVRSTVQKAPMISASTVDRVAIETFNRNSLDDAASLIPGVSASNSGGSRNERLLFVRGFNRFQVPVSIDGIRVYLPADNRLDYGRFVTADLAAIQVAKGYASVLDGPGAMGGAINLVTRKPVEELEVEARGTLELDRNLGYAGYTGSALLGTRQEKWYAQVSFAQSFQDHWDLPGGFEPTLSEDGGERDFSRTRDWRLNARIGFTPNARDEYSISYMRQEGSKNAPLSTTDPVSIQRNWSWPYWDLDSIYFLSRTSLTDNVTLKTRAYRNSFDNLLRAFDDATQTTQTRGRAFDSFYEDTAWGASAELALAVSSTDSMAVALHYRSDKHVESQKSFAPAPFTEPDQVTKEDTWSLATEIRGEIAPSVAASAGLSYDWRDLKRAEDYGTPPGGGPDAVFSYPVRDADAVNMQARIAWAAMNDLELVASISSRARFPTIFERFSSRFGGAVSNPDLEAERATNFELGANYERQGLSVNGALFYSRLDNVIVSFPFIYQGQAVSQSRNMGTGEYYGGEISAEAQLSPQFSLGGNYTYTGREIDDPNDTSFRPTDVPKHQGFLWAEWQPTERFSIVPSINVASDRWTVTTDGALYYQTGSHADLSLRLDYEIIDGVVAGAGVRNALDELYTLTDGFPEPGRRFFLSLRLEH